MYVEDTAISLSSRNIDELQNDLNLGVLKLQDWLHAYKLSLNVVKIQCYAMSHVLLWSGCHFLFVGIKAVVLSLLHVSQGHYTYVMWRCVYCSV